MNELYESDVSQKSLPPQSIPSQSIQSIPITFLIPTDFMGLLVSEIFSLSSEANSMDFSSTQEKL